MQTAATRAENYRGAAFMAASMAAFCFNDALMKSVSDEMPVFQAVFLRGALACVLIGALAHARGVARLSKIAPADRRIVALRALCEVGSTVCFLTALFQMPLANVTSILLASPLALTLIGATLLKEPVGWRRWSAIFVGFAGVLLIVKPGAAAFDGAALWAVGAVGFVCVRDLATRRLSTETPSLVVTLTTAASLTLIGGVATLEEGWAPLSLGAGLRLAVAACFVFGGYYFSVATMRVGDLGFTSPFRYTVLIWALLLGWAAFGDVPGALTLAGAALIVLSGAYTFHRESQRGS